MDAIILNEPGRFSLIEKDMPLGTGDDEALLKVLKIGVCGTDLHAFSGEQPFFNYPRILGHELAVEVMEIGKDVKNINVGDICTVEPYRNPIAGQAVRRGKTNCGEHLTVLGVHEDGGMQEYFTYPASNLYPFHEVTTDNLVLIEPLAIGCHAVFRAEIQKDDIVLIIGAGPIGLTTALFAQLTGARTMMMEINKGRLDFSKKHLKIADTILTQGNPEKQLKEVLHGDLPTVIIDATGNKKSMLNTFKYAASGATIVFVGLFMGEVYFNDPLFHKKELTLKSTRAGLPSDFSHIGKLIQNKVIDPSFMITHRVNFRAVPQEFASLDKPENQVMKAIIEMN